MILDIGSKALEGAHSGRGNATPEQINHFFDGTEEGDYELQRFKSARPYNRFGNGGSAGADEVGQRAADAYDPLDLFHSSSSSSSK